MFYFTQNDESERWLYEDNLKEAVIEFIAERVCADFF